jgi:hypothetical protein
MKILEPVKNWLAIQIWKHTMTCQELTRLASQAQDRPLSLVQRVRLRLHAMVCVWCHRYVKHLEFMHRTAPGLEAKTGQTSPKALSSDAKERMKKALQGHSH